MLQGAAEWHHFEVVLVKKAAPAALQGNMLSQQDIVQQIMWPIKASKPFPSGDILSAYLGRL